MDSILNDFSTTALVRAVKTNLYDFFYYLARDPQTDFLVEEGLARWHTQVPYPWYNGVLATRASTPADTARIEELIDWFRAREVGNFTWWPAPDLPAADWAPLLAAHGFRQAQGPPGMTIDLHSLPDRSVAGLRIVPVEDEPRLREWTATFIVGYELPASWEAPLYGMTAGIGLGLPVRNYLGYLNGEPVATANLFLSAGVAGVQYIATRPEARGRGIGAAMTLAPLLDARAMGYRIGILQSSDMGYPIYRGLGFQEVCRLPHFYWDGARAGRAPVPAAAAVV